MYRLLVSFTLFFFLIQQAGFAQQNSYPNKITIVFPYFEPVNPIFEGTDHWTPAPMTKLSGNTYLFDAGNHPVNTPFLFYVKYTLPPFNSGQSYYVSTKQAGLNRILYAKVYVNDVLLNNAYVHSDGNIHYKFSSNGSVVQVDDSGQKLINDRIPPEVHWPIYTIHHPNNPSHTNSNINQVIAWAQVLTDNNFDMPVKVEIDYLRLYARTSSGDILLTSDEYNSSFNQVNDGGLYWRYPFFPPGFDEHEPMPAVTENGVLVFYPHQHRDTVWHFWNSQWPRPATNPEHTSYYTEIKYRITGKAAIQIGIDFYGGSGNNTYRILEAGGSDWGFETYNGEWNVLTFDTRPAVTSADEPSETMVPQEFKLLQNYPNPFNPETTIEVYFPGSGNFSLIIYTTEGERVEKLYEGPANPGSRKFTFNGKSLASGAYFVEAIFNNKTITQKLLLIR